MEFRLIVKGTAPLIMNNGRLANPLDPAAKALKRLSGKRNKTEDDLMEIFRVGHNGALYLDPDIGPYIPGDNFWRCLYDAAKKSRRGPKVKEGVFCPMDVNPLAYKGPRTPDGLWEDENFRFMASRKVQTNRVPFCRPIFRTWTADTIGIYDPTIIELEEIKDIATTGGHIVGLGDWRPRYGRFTAVVEAA